MFEHKNPLIIFTIEQNDILQNYMRVLSVNKSYTMLSANSFVYTRITVPLISSIVPRIINWSVTIKKNNNKSDF